MERQKKKNELTITRIFDAPVELVWRAWTDPEYVRRWWGPKGYTVPVAKIDARVGGRFLIAMRSPEGKDIWGTGAIRSIEPLKKIVYTDSFSDENGNVVPASVYGMTGEFPLELLVTVTLRRQKGMTHFTLRHAGMPASEMEGARAGWSESFDKLDVLMEEEKARRAKNVVVIRKGRPATLTRIIDAPPERVFRAMTDPLLIPRWWGPVNLTTVVDHMDARPGGSWRIIHRDAGGNEYAFHGVYHEVSPLRIVQTWEYEGAPGHVMLEITTLEDLGGRTKMTGTAVTSSPEALDGMLKTGMVEGWMETIDRLATLAEQPAQPEASASAPEKAVTM